MKSTIAARFFSMKGSRATHMPSWVMPMASPWVKRVARRLVQLRDRR